MARIKTDLGALPGAVFIPGCVSFRLIWQLPNGKLANNVLHASFAGSISMSQSTVDSTFPAILAAWAASGMKPFQKSTLTLAHLGIRDMSPIAGSTASHAEFVSGVPGAAGSDATTDALPASIAFAVTLRSPQGGQAGRGRIYFPGFTEAVNTPAGTALNTVGDACVAFATGIQTVMHDMVPSLTMCIAHPARAAYTGRAGAVHEARDAGTVPVVSISKHDDNWDSQRRRGRL